MNDSSTTQDFPPADELDVTIFVSCYNEQDTILATLGTILDYMRDRTWRYEVLIYDDGSRDQSVSVVREFIGRNGLADRFQLVANEVNAGIGINYFRAAGRGRGRYFFVMHGDNAVQFDTLCKVFDRMGQADIIIPHYSPRLIDGPDNWDHRTLFRRVMSIVFSGLVRLLSGTRLRYYNGPVLHQRRLVLKHRLRAFGLGYQSELLCRVLREPGIRYEELKVHNYEGATGSRTAFKLRNVLSVAGSLARIFLRRGFACEARR